MQLRRSQVPNPALHVIAAAFIVAIALGVSFLLVASIYDACFVSGNPSGDAVACLLFITCFAWSIVLLMIKR